MKTKKTIRRLPPLSRKLAHFQRDLHAMQRRLTTIISEVTKAERELAIYALMEKQEAEDACRDLADPHIIDSPGGLVEQRMEDALFSKTGERWLP